MSIEQRLERVNEELYEIEQLMKELPVSWETTSFVHAFVELQRAARRAKTEGADIDRHRQPLAQPVVIEVTK